MFEGDVVLHLVAGHEAQLTVWALVHVGHGHQCRAATFAPGDMPTRQASRQIRTRQSPGSGGELPRRKGTPQWASVTAGSPS
jgi:hypothetical protein